MSDVIYYAIGDVHGEAERLALLHDFIADDIARLGAPASIIHLGDLIDRGPDSRGAIARAMAIETHPPTGARACAILGNHEEMMLNARASDAPDDLAHWCGNGGLETVNAYERVNGAFADWRDAVDAAHWNWLSGLPTMLRDEDRKFAFVHGGIDPQTFPDCDPEIHLWTRSAKFTDHARWPQRDALVGLLVVHGHTPTDDFEPIAEAHRINVDTGAVFGGPLTCVVLAPDEKPRFLQVRA